ncbi:hypothetical protein LEP1GSC170_4540 [Leptospira interrogans serovar Bataviae str. HAI135]|nr:hypothetical protein LEP1GSC170_4540 [Leptospira interrogans serovar Bataviae str. HAI135]
MNPFQKLDQKNKLKGASDSKTTKEYSENSFLFKKYSGKSEFLNPYFLFEEGSCLRSPSEVIE